MNEKIKGFTRLIPTLGELPTSYLISMTFEEQQLFLCSKMNEIINFINTTMDQQIHDYIEQEFNNIMINAMYDSTNEKLILYKEEVNNG